MTKKHDLEWHLCQKKSDYRLAKRAMSERYLGVPVRGRRIRDVKIRPELLANLVGIGVSEKRCDRAYQGKPAVTFYVREKLPRSRLPRALRFPQTIDGMTCDVVSCGPVLPAQGGRPFEPQDPLKPGAQIQVEGGNPGTLGAFVRDADGDVCMISNCHVLSAELGGGEGEEVRQPAAVFAGSRPVATVKKVIPILTNSENAVDVALAKLDVGVEHDPAIPGIGAITGTAVPERRDRVSKFGQATELTSSRFDSVDTDLVVPFNTLTAIFSEVYVFRRGRFADGGDSGSVVVEDGTGKVFGMIFATSALKNFAIPASAIESKLPGITWL